MLDFVFGNTHYWEWMNVSQLHKLAAAKTLTGMLVEALGGDMFLHLLFTLAFTHTLRGKQDSRVGEKAETKIYTAAQNHPSWRSALRGPQVRWPLYLSAELTSTLFAIVILTSAQLCLVTCAFLYGDMYPLFPRSAETGLHVRAVRKGGSHRWWRTWVGDLISSLSKANFSFAVSAWLSSAIITHRGHSRERKRAIHRWKIGAPCPPEGHGVPATCSWVTEQLQT